jgi:hypothetical protein
MAIFKRRRVGLSDALQMADRRKETRKKREIDVSYDSTLFKKMAEVSVCSSCPDAVTCSDDAFHPEVQYR